MKVLVCFLVCISGGLAAAEAPLKIYTESLPPLQIIEGKKVVGGTAHQSVMAILQLAQVEVEPQALPWARIYRQVSSTPNVLVYSMVRTAQREPNFIWLAPLVTLDLYLVSLQQRDLPVNSIEQARQYRVGIKRHDVTHQYLTSLGFAEGENMVIGADTEDTFSMLLRGRVDLIPATDVMLESYCQTAGCQPQQFFRKSIAVSELEQRFYLVASQGSDPALLAPIQQAIAKLQRQGRLPPPQ